MPGRSSWTGDCQGSTLGPEVSTMERIVFAVGQHYANGKWGYEVLELNGSVMQVRSDDGQTRTLQIETAARLESAVAAKALRASRRKHKAASLG
jgi:hypothetical protein